MTLQKTRPTAKELSIAIICLVLVLGAAFIAASLIQDMFKLSPPCPDLPCNKTPFAESKRLDLHRTFFTAWAAIILITPALCTFWFRRVSESSARYWLAFWTVSFVAFLVHFYWSVFIMFDGDWSRIFNKVENGMRVTLPKFDTLFTVWWGVDVLLAWFIQSEKGLIRIQRIIVHIVAFGLFFAGSFLEGETGWSQALGLAMGVAVLISFLIWLIRWLKRRKSMVTSPA